MESEGRIEVVAHTRLHSIRAADNQPTQVDGQLLCFGDLEVTRIISGMDQLSQQISVVRVALIPV